jgi:hypothetical protein
MKRHSPRGLAALILLVFLTACPEKKPAGPPPELVGEIAAAEAEFGQAGAYSPADSDTQKYKDLVAQAKSLMDGGDYPQAMTKAREAELEAVRLHGQLVYNELMKVNPAANLTYNYRMAEKKSEDAEKAGDLPGAIAAAREALDLINQVSHQQSACQQEATKTLEQLKKDIESTYRAPRPIENQYWDLKDAIPEGNCARINQMIYNLKKDLEYFRSTNLTTTQIFVVSAPQDYIKQFGEPWMYRQVTDQGYLNERLVQVRTGTPVTFIRSMMFARGKTLYYVRDNATGREGWMAEERVWPEKGK